jgi:hypothetical protein
MLATYALCGFPPGVSASVVATLLTDAPVPASRVSLVLAYVPKQLEFTLSSANAVTALSISMAAERATTVCEVKRRSREEVKT